MLCEHCVQCALCRRPPASVGSRAPCPLLPYALHQHNLGPGSGASPGLSAHVMGPEPGSLLALVPRLGVQEEEPCGPLCSPIPSPGLNDDQECQEVGEEEHWVLMPWYPRRPLHTLSCHSQVEQGCVCLTHPCSPPKEDLE